jgi:integrase
MARKKKRSSGLRLVQRPGSPYWQITGTLRGTPIRESTGTADLVQAEKLRRAREDEIIDASVHGPRAVATFSRAVNLYIDTDEDRDTRFVKLLNGHFGQTRIADITDETVIEFRKLHYPKASAATTNRQVYTPLIAILNVACDAKLCDKPSFKRPEIKHKVVDPADDVWIAEFMSKVPCLRLRTLVLLMTTTGCRVAEACRVRWENIDLARRTVLLEKTKSGTPRRLVIGENLVEALQTLQKQELPRNARVFGFGNRWSVNTALKRACKKAGIKFYSSHKLGRHAFAARLLAKGETLAVVAKAGGWSEKSLALVARVYGHLEQSAVDETVRDAADGLTVGKPV